MGLVRGLISIMFWSLAGAAYAESANDETLLAAQIDSESIIRENSGQISVGAQSEGHDAVYVAWAAVGKVGTIAPNVAGDETMHMLERQFTDQDRVGARVLLTILSGDAQIEVEIVGEPSGEIQSDLVVTTAVADSLAAPKDESFLVLIEPIEHVPEIERVPERDAE